MSFSSYSELLSGDDGANEGILDPDPGLEAYYAYHRLRKVGPAQRMMDELRGPEHRVSLALRGGGGGDDDADDDGSEFWTDEDSDLSMKDTSAGHDADDADLSLRGGSGEEETSLKGVLGRVQRGATIKDPSQQETTFGLSVDDKVRNGWIPMHGFMGIVWFNIFSLYSYVDAVDRLLCLDNRAGITYNIYFFDRDTDYTSSEEQGKLLNGDPESGMTVTCAPIGDYSHDDLALSTILGRLSRDLESGGDVNRTVIFIAAHSDPIPLVWEPAKKHRVIKLTLEWPNAPVLDRLDVAYVRVPPEYKASSHHYSNFFGLWMARACRVLGAGRNAYRPGRPAVPDAFFALKGAENKGSSYGGLSFTLDMWQEIMQRWEGDESQPITLVALTPASDGREGEDEVVDRWNLFVPGYSAPFDHRTQQYLLFLEASNLTVVHQRIRDLMRASLSASAFNQLDAVELYLPGDTFFGDNQTAAPIHRVPMIYKSDYPLMDDQRVLRKSLQSWIESMAHSDIKMAGWNGIDAFSTFITLRPIFLQYSIWGGGLSRIGWMPDQTSLDEFYKLATQAASTEERTQFRDGTARLAITQGKDSPDSVLLKKPDFLVTPQTTESDWRQITQQIVDPEVAVQWVTGREHEPRFVEIESTQPFGYRDIYEPPLSFVYPDLSEGQYPGVARHKDWQMLAEDVLEGLPTIQPWEEQPPPPQGPIGSVGAVRHLDFGEPVSITAKMAQVTGVDSPFTSEGADTPQSSEPMDTPQTGEDEDFGGADEADDFDEAGEEDYEDAGEGKDLGEAGGEDYGEADEVENIDDAGEAEDFGEPDEPEDVDMDNQPGEQSGAGEPQDPPEDLPRPTRPPVARRLFPKSDMDKAAEKRKYSYTHPLSVHTEGNIPIYAPPLERLLRPPTESMPIVTQAFLTPTEVLQLQRDYFDLRSIVLRRSVQCNYADCTAVFPANHPERMDRHLQDCHVSWGCNFCDELLYKHWPPEQKVQHYLDNHADYLEALHKMNKNKNAEATAAADPDPDSDPGNSPENPFVSRARSISRGSVPLSARAGASPRRRSSGGFIDPSDIGIVLSSPRKTSTGAAGASRGSKVTIPGPTSPSKATSRGSVESRKTGSTQPGPARSPETVRPGTPGAVRVPTKEPAPEDEPMSEGERRSAKRLRELFPGPRPLRKNLQLTPPPPPPPPKVSPRPQEKSPRLEKTKEVRVAGIRRPSLIRVRGPPTPLRLQNFKPPTPTPQPASATEPKPTPTPKPTPNPKPTPTPKPKQTPAPKPKPTPTPSLFPKRIPPPGPPLDPLERLWKFCARCGRDHTLLSDATDRANHDRVCYPGNLLGTFCRHCSGRDPKGVKPHIHPYIRDGPQTFCHACGLEDWLLDEGYQGVHAENCRPLEPEGRGVCPWCGEGLEDGEEVHGECEGRVEGGKGKRVVVEIKQATKGGVTTPGKRKAAAAAAGGNTGSARVKRNKVAFREAESERYFNAEEPPSAIH